MSTRERQVRFIREFGQFALSKAVEEMIRKHGADWLTDEQLAEITSSQVSDWRFTQHMNMRNRKIAAERKHVQGASLAGEAR